MRGYVQTVSGPISPDALGITMTHEHLLWDQTCWWKGEPEELSLREFVHQPVSIEILGQIYYHAHLHLDNIRQYSVDLAIAEAMYLKRAGGHSLVDVTFAGHRAGPACPVGGCGGDRPQRNHGVRLLHCRIAPGGDA